MIRRATSLRWNIAMIAIFAIMFAIAFLTVYALVMTFSNSLKASSDYVLDPVGLPREPILDNYPLVVESQQDHSLGGLLYFINSLAYTCIGTFLVILFALAAGFGLSKLPQKSTPFIYNSFMAGNMLTFVAIAVPLFIVFSNLNLVGSHLSVLIVYLGLGLPFAIYMTTEFIRELPTSLIEAARIDGAGYFSIFFHIIVPICKPIIVTLMILTTTAIWNDFSISMIMGDQYSFGVQAALGKFFGARSSSYGPGFAAIVIGLLPTLVFYLIFQKRITSGTVASALK